jgi:hypothetical protein
LGWLLSTGWLQDRALRSETTYLVLETCASAGEEVFTLLVNDIRQHWDDDQYAPHRAYEFLTKIAAVVNDEE